MNTGNLPEFGLINNNLIAPAGTSIPMAQSAAPLGWTSASITDTSMRYNSSSGGSGGGSTGWSGWNFGGTFNVNSFVISGSQLPVHNHVINISDPGHGHGVSDGGHGHGVNDGGHSHGSASGTGFWEPGSTVLAQGSGGATSQSNGSTAAASTGISIQSSGSNISVNGSGTGITASSNNAGSSSAVTPTYTTPQVLYKDHILAVKS